jgi:hypothetical protein
MGNALTIGIMFLLFGFIGYMQEEGPSTFLDRIHPFAYILLGGMVLINCLIHFLTA